MRRTGWHGRLAGAARWRFMACSVSILLAVCLLTVGAAGNATETLTLHLVAYVPEKTQVAVGRNGDPFIRTTGTPEDFQLDEWTETYSGIDYKVVCVTYV